MIVSAEPAPKPAAVMPAARPRRSGNHLSAAQPVASDVSRRKSVQLVSSFAYDPSTWVSLTGGLRGHAGRTTCFRRLDDLLGAAYLTDIDPYLIDDRYFGDRLQNDLRRPGRPLGPPGDHNPVCFG